MSDPPGDPTVPPPAEHVCPECGAALPAGAVLCIACGFDLQEGRRLETIRQPEGPRPELVERPAPRIVEPSETSPERKPDGEKDGSLESRIIFLEEQVRTLQRRVGATRLTSPEFATRMFAVFGLWLVAFVALVFGLGALGALLWVLIVGL